MAHRLIVGITGGIATGKSTVLQEFARHGFAVASADTLAHHCISKGTFCFRAIVRHFGKEVLSKEGEIDRKKLGEIVFVRSAERHFLERQIHPCVIKKLKHFIRTRQGLIALDIPLLFEARLQSLVDRIVVVFSSEKNQRERLKKRNLLNHQQAHSRIAAQWPLYKKCLLSDFVIDNSGTIAELREKVNALIRRAALVQTNPIRR